ncbi:hypothetical protein PT7_1432 [Pusillimonas sp. T7-7]|uniref:YhdP family protein n=1 Tax=Pusillimonas sp. (strain T7-7) TaxID=1007105 RepID=UPI0002084B38|nr:YhdP family protein [Pusillimonas sp. T7-7]AEC19972.1 hypothetical protein PT7_1432 [Pusillimonas sp. T7-7]
MLQFSTLILKLVGKIALIAYFVLGLLFLGARYWVFPNVNEWRPQIERQLSQALNADVSLGSIAIDWKGLNPKLKALDVQLADEQGRRLLAVPEAQATISWRSLLSGDLQLVMLQASGLDLTLRRDLDDQVWVMGRSFSLGEPMSSPEDVGNAADWLLGQRDIMLRSATLRWIDETRNAPPLVLERVALRLSNRQADHRFILQADIPEALGKSLDLRGEFLHTPTKDSERFDLNQGRGQLYAHVENMQPLGWAPWVDMPRSLKSGQVSVRSWLKFQAGGIESLTSDVTVKNGYWESTRYGAKARAVRLFMTGPWRDYTRLLDQSGDEPRHAVENPEHQGVEYRLLAQQLEIQAPNIFQLPLALDHLVSRGTVQRPDTGWRVEAAQLDLSGQSLAASLQGRWQQHGVDSSGLIDMRGDITRLAIPAIKNYLPSSVNPDARDWMEHGLVAGQISDASLVLQGDLDEFPFNDSPGAGDFRIAGRYSGAIIDYLPAHEKSPGWPRLVDMQGNLSLHGADLRLHADQAVMWPTPEQSIQLNDVEARIPNLAEDSVLSITGQTQADSSVYLALMTHTPLGSMLDGQFNETRATGTWSVPLALTIPLMHSRDTTVKGAIHFSGGDLRLTPEMPVFSKVTGTLEFTDTGFSTPGLKSQFLGGPLAIDGGVGGGLKGLRFQGKAQAGALREYTGLDGLKRLDGQMTYQASLHQGKGKDRAFVLDIQSDLIGLAMDFPPPLKKAANQRLPLKVSWQRDDDGKNMALNLSLGEWLRAKLLHRENAKGGAYFHTAALGLNQKAVLPKSGFALDLSYPVVDIDAWNDLVNGFSNTLPGAEKARSQPLLPAVQTLRLQADKVLFKGVMLDTFAFTAHRPQPQQWRADITSSQTAGTLFWREANGRVAGRVDANFDRLSLGSEQASEKSRVASDFQVDEDLDIPGVNLHVRKFRLYGREVGELSLVGVNQARGHLWKLENLTLKSPSAELSGSGMWRLSGANRGLTLEAEAHITNLGDYLDQIGQKDVMKAGEGTIQGKLEWRNMPWDFSKADLNGQIEFSLHKGRFSSLNSYSARLLELLSLQSVKRLARLDFNPAGLTREGFPYDDLRGTVKVSNGLMSTSDYRVIGPVGTIVIGGDINLINEQMDLQAVVIPNLDISGAAVAAGIAINPIVGVGAFLTQWLLQAPLAKAMTVQYHIDGKWDDPQIKELTGSGPEPEAGAKPDAARQPEAVIEH